jgi:hypothetical protein
MVEQSRDVSLGTQFPDEPKIIGCAFPIDLESLHLGRCALDGHIIVVIAVTDILQPDGIYPFGNARFEADNHSRPGGVI